MENVSWQTIEQLAETGLKPIQYGFTAARRGIIFLPGGKTLFVKIAVDQQTQDWVEQEIRAYEWLRAHKYQHAPNLVMKGSNGFALDDLSTWDWTNTWHAAKIEAALQAMDALVALSPQAQETFASGDFGENLWRNLPQDATYNHIPDLAPALRKEAIAILTNSEIREKYHAHAERNPYQGKDLVHYDVRSDNFAYSDSNKSGLLVDWNWLCLGSKSFDQTAFLVDVHKHYDVLADYADRLDVASLAWLVGFWLMQASIVPETPRMATLRLFQLESAVRAHHMLQQLERQGL